MGLLGDKIRLECESYLLRTLEPADAALDWGGWLANPTTARMLNLTPRIMSLSEREAYVAEFDSRVKHLLGIWEKATGRLVGMWQIDVDEGRKEYLLNVIVGVADARAKGAREQTCDMIYAHFFENLAMVATRCTVSERNDKMIQFLLRRGWTHVGTGEKPSADGPRPVKIHVFRLTRDEWRASSPQGRSEDDAARKAG